MRKRSSRSYKVQAVCLLQSRKTAEKIHNHGWPHPQVKGETRCDCGAHLVVKLDKARGVWFVEFGSSRHFLMSTSMTSLDPMRCHFCGHIDG